MWFEVLLAVLILLYIYNKGLYNLSVRSLLKMLIVVVICLMIYNYLK